MGWSHDEPGTTFWRKRSMPAKRHLVASDGAKNRTSHPDFGSKGTETAPATRSVSGICVALSTLTTGKTALLYFRSLHAEYKVET
jgi:hypothetical protein